MLFSLYTMLTRVELLTIKNFPLVFLERKPQEEDLQPRVDQEVVALTLQLWLKNSVRNWPQGELEE